MNRKATDPMSDESSGKALDDWADRIAALEPEVSAGMASYAKRLAGDKRLAKADRQFATAQADALRRAIRRAKAGKR